MQGRSEAGFNQARRSVNLNYSPSSKVSRGQRQKSRLWWIL
jgi:hypothetical protein